MLDKTTYVLRVDGTPGWRNHTKAATLAMCPGNENWDGEKFRTVLEWATRHFDFIRIDLSDTLGRHNLMALGTDDATALRQSKNDGDLWIKANGHTLLDCGKPFEIVRWDRWRLAPEYPTMHENINRVLFDDRMRAAVGRDIATYRARLLARGQEPGPNFSVHALNYLKEELACITLQASALPGSSRLYPAAEPRSSVLLRSGIAPEITALKREYYIAFNLRHRQPARDIAVRPTTKKHPSEPENRA